MATSKSTVLGLRLDHERRAWVEAEAARRGVTVRALFEEFIDGAQGGETAAGDSVAVGADADSDRGVYGEIAEPAMSSSGPEAGPSQGVNGPWAQPTSHPSLRPNIGAVTALPGRLVRGAFSLPTNLIKTSGRCALRSLEGCPAFKRLGGRPQ